MFRHVGARGGFQFHHVRVELRRAAHGLAGVVDDEVQPRFLLHQLRAERLDARGVAQVEAVDLEAVAPLREVGFLGVALGAVAREARGDDQPRAGAQQLDAGLVADLDAPAGEQRDASAQVGGLGALAEIEVAAFDAHLVVERMQRRVLALADVAVLRLERFARRLGIGIGHMRRLREEQLRVAVEAFGREEVRRREHWPAAQLADAGALQRFLFLRDPRLRLGALPRLAVTPVRVGIGVVEAADRGLQPLLLVARQRLERGHVGGDGFEFARGDADAVDEVGRRVGGRVRRGVGHGDSRASRAGRGRGGATG